jgi:hypothetical protein
MAVLAGTDFFTVEVLTWRGLVTYYVLFFLHLETRRVTLAGITRHPTESWITQMARNAVDEACGGLDRCRYVLHDRGTKFCHAFDQVLASEGIRCLKLPPHSPNLNAFAERWVRSVKEECLSKLIFFGESSLRRALTEFVTHYHSERNHQGKGNSLLFPAPLTKATRSTVAVASASAVCFDIIAAPLEYFGSSNQPPAVLRSLRGRPAPSQNPAPAHTVSCCSVHRSA